MAKKKSILHDKIEALKARFASSQIAFTDEASIERIECESSLYKFFEHAWPWIDSGSPFIHGWHIKAMAEHLEALYRGDIKKLIINYPPRSSKSLLASVAFNAWVWTISPSKKFLYFSNVEKLSKSHAFQARNLINTTWYQSLWGNKFNLVRASNSTLRFDNSEGGFRMAAGMESNIIGFGADLLMADDPNDPAQVESDSIRNTINNTFDKKFSHRFNNPHHFGVCVVMQRSHEEDLTGHMLAKDDPNIVHLCLPMEYESARKCSTIILPSTNGRIWTDPRNEEEELLWPEHITAEVVEEMKIGLGSEYAISGQLQQRPSPGDGAILRREWFRPWMQDEPPECKFIVQSWDTAYSDKSTPGACYSACTTWGIFAETPTKNNIILLALWTGQVEYPLLRKIAVKFARNFQDLDTDDLSLTGPRSPPDIILIENKSSGGPLLQDFAQAGLQVAGFNPNKYGDKESRCRYVSHLLESGKLFLPTKPRKIDNGFSKTERVFSDMSADLINACVKFPYGREDDTDIVDSMSQALIRIKTDGWVLNANDPEIEELHKLYRRPTKAISSSYPL